MDSQCKETQELVDGVCNDFWYKQWNKVGTKYRRSQACLSKILLSKSQHQLILGQIITIGETIIGKTIIGKTLIGKTRIEKAIIGKTIDLI